MPTDVYQVVTDRIVSLLEAGTVPWRMPWKGQDQAPQNLVSRRPYRGINSFLLNAAGYQSPFWLTFNQVGAVGGRIRKGERSFPVIFWRILDPGESPVDKKIPLLRYYSVFNANQCDGLQELPISVEQSDFRPIEQCERLVGDMPNPVAQARHLKDISSIRACRTLNHGPKICLAQRNPDSSSSESLSRPEPWFEPKEEHLPVLKST